MDDIKTLSFEEALKEIAKEFKAMDRNELRQMIKGYRNDPIYHSLSYAKDPNYYNKMKNK